MNSTPSAHLRQREIAIRHLQSVLELDPDNLKALYRKCNILIDRAEYAEARQVLERLESLHPARTDVKRLRKHLEKSDQSTRNAQRECYQRIFSNMQAEEAREKQLQAEQEREARRSRLIQEDAEEEEEEEAPVGVDDLVQGVITDLGSGMIER